MVGEEDTKFVMISGDPVEIQVKLNNLIREPSKFICLNDNIDYKLRTEASQLKSILRSYYSSLLPLKSSFELSDSRSTIGQKSNTHLEYSSSFSLPHRNEESKPNAQQNSQRTLFFLPLLVGVFILCLYLFKRLVWSDNDEKYLLDRARSRSIGSRINLIRKSPAKPSAMHSIKKLDTSGSKKHKVSNAFRRKMQDATGSSDDEDSDMISKLSDTSTNSSSSANHSANLSSTLNNETVKKTGSLGAREGLSRKKKSTSVKKLNITTI
jgi:hypothetical protein